MQRCSLRSLGFVGSPSARRYWVEATTMIGIEPTRRATKLESASSPLRIATSIASSTRFVVRSVASTSIALKPGDLLAHRRLADSQLPGHSRKTPTLNDPHEDSDRI